MSKQIRCASDVNDEDLELMRSTASNLGCEHLIDEEASARDIFVSLWGAFCDGHSEDEAERLVAEEVENVRSFYDPSNA